MPVSEIVDASELWLKGVELCVTCFFGTVTTVTGLLRAEVVEDWAGTALARRPFTTTTKPITTPIGNHRRSTTLR